MRAGLPLKEAVAAIVSQARAAAELGGLVGREHGRQLEFSSYPKVEAYLVKELTSFTGTAADLEKIYPLGKDWVVWAITLRHEGAIRAATGFVDAGNAWNDLLVLRSGGASEADWDLACERLASACKRVKPGAGRKEGTHGTEFGPAAIWMSAWRCVEQAARNVRDWRHELGADSERGGSAVEGPVAEGQGPKLQG